VSIRRLQLLFAAYGIALGFTLPWNVPQLTDAGMDPGQVGAVLGLAALLSLVGYPLWGLIADTLLGRDRTLILAAMLAALSGVGIVVSGDQPAWLAAFIVLQLVCVAPWAPIADALALGELGTQAHAYGRVRSVTSAGWVVAVLLAGAIATAAGLVPVRALFVVTAVGLAGAVVAARRSPRSLLRRPERSVSGERLTWTAFRSALRASPVFLPFLGVLLIASIATNASYAFISLRILDEGGGPMLIALASAMPAIVEVPMFTMIGRLSDRFGLRTLYIAGTLLSGLQMLIIAIAPVPIVIALVRLLDGAGFALRYSSIVLIAGAALPDRLRATGQSMASLMTSGIAPVVSGPVGGWVYGSFGGTALFVACSAVLLASSALAAVVLAPLAAARRALATAAGTRDP
jgi:PPP family 3-phenylpropionic acid transporter